jgi:hypothetical protein
LEISLFAFSLPSIINKKIAVIFLLLSFKKRFLEGKNFLPRSEKKTEQKEGEIN